MRKRVIFGLIISSLMLIFSISMSVNYYIYSTTNRVGVVGDGEFHLKSILTLVFTLLSGSLLLVKFIILAHHDKKRKLDSRVPIN